MALLMPDKTDFKSQVDMRHKERHLYKGSLHNKDTITNIYTLTLGLLRKWSTLTEFREKNKTESSTVIVQNISTPTFNDV